MEEEGKKWGGGCCSSSSRVQPFWNSTSFSSSSLKLCGPLLTQPPALPQLHWPTRNEESWTISLLYRILNRSAIIANHDVGISVRPASSCLSPYVVYCFFSPYFLLHLCSYKASTRREFATASSPEGHISSSGVCKHFRAFHVGGFASNGYAILHHNANLLRERQTTYWARIHDACM